MRNLTLKEKLLPQPPSFNKKSHYEIHGQLGSGTFGKVMVSEHLLCLLTSIYLYPRGRHGIFLQVSCRPRNEAPLSAGAIANYLRLPLAQMYQPRLLSHLRQHLQTLHYRLRQSCHRQLHPPDRYPHRYQYRVLCRTIPKIPKKMRKTEDWWRRLHWRLSRRRRLKGMSLVYGARWRC